MTERKRVYGPRCVPRGGGGGIVRATPQSCFSNLVSTVTALPILMLSYHLASSDKFPLVFIQSAGRMVFTCFCRVSWPPCRSMFWSKIVKFVRVSCSIFCSFLLPRSLEIVESAGLPCQSYTSLFLATNLRFWIVSASTVFVHRAHVKEIGTRPVL
jgi:hypothetical protein